MTDRELRAYLDARRAAIAGARASAVHQTTEWAADGAVRELDRLERWLDLLWERDRVVQLVQETAAEPFELER